jgi:hypothetical protein
MPKQSWMIGAIACLAAAAVVLVAALARAVAAVGKW